jgi:hypothetical protein
MRLLRDHFASKLTIDRFEPASSSFDLIQIADLLAGALGRTINTAGDGANDELAAHILKRFKVKDVVCDTSIDMTLRTG